MDLDILFCLVTYSNPLIGSNEYSIESISLFIIEKVVSIIKLCLSLISDGYVETLIVSNVDMICPFVIEKNKPIRIIRLIKIKFYYPLIC